MAADKLMTVAEFGARLGVSRAAAYRLVAAGRITTVDVSCGGRPKLRVTEAAFERYLAANTIPGRAA